MNAAIKMMKGELTKLVEQHATLAKEAETFRLRVAEVNREMEANVATRNSLAEAIATLEKPTAPVVTEKPVLRSKGK